MRGRWQSGLMAAAAVGLVLTMTSCSVQASTGDELYRDGERRYVAYSTIMHSVLMAIYEGDWAVYGGSFGAAPMPCALEGDTTGEYAGYTFSSLRVLEPEQQIDVDAVVGAATEAFEKAGVEVNTAVYGEGDRQEINVIGTGGDLGRGVVTIRPDRNMISTSADPGCFPGDAGDLSDMVYGGVLVYEGAYRRVPAFEGPDWQPRFYFPEDGSPLYYNEDDTPIMPPPTTTDFPEAPYGK